MAFLDLTGLQYFKEKLEEKLNPAYAHGVTNKGTSLSSGLWKITVNDEGHVTAGTAVQKSDITALGIPSTNTWVANSSSAAGYVAAGGSSNANKVWKTNSSGEPAWRDDADTDTKVTSSANHYTPATASGSDVTASATGATAAWSIDVVKGVTLNTDGKGHVTGMSVTSGKIPANPNTNFTTHLYAGSGTAANAATTNGNTKLTVVDNSTVRNTVTLKGTGGTTVVSDASGVVTINSTDNNTTYSAGTGLSLSSTTFNHSNSVTAGTAGTSTATSGSTLAVPYVTYDAQGHVTASGTHTHTISGFLTSHQTIKQDGVTGATVNRFGTCSTAAATAAKVVSITTGTFSLEAGATVIVKFSNANTAASPTLNVNSKGAKNIFHQGAQITSDSIERGLLAGVCEFIYDGTQWHLIGNYHNTTYETTTSTTNGLMSASYYDVVTGLSSAIKVGKTSSSVTIPANSQKDWDWLENSSLEQGWTIAGVVGTYVGGTGHAPAIVRAASIDGVRLANTSSSSVSPTVSVYYLMIKTRYFTSTTNTVTSS